MLSLPSIRDGVSAMTRAVAGISRAPKRSGSWATRSREIGPHVETDEAHAEFAGILRLGGAGKAAAFAAIRAGALRTRRDAARSDPPSPRARARGHSSRPRGDWAELDAKQDLARFILGTKAESLERLRTMNHGGEIGALVSFTLGDWRADSSRLIDRALAEIPADRLIVRSSALLEDSWLESGAGRHESVPDVAAHRGRDSSMLSTRSSRRTGATKPATRYSCRRCCTTSP